MEMDDINKKLESITDGNLEENVDVQSSVEFMELSHYINSMVKSLLDNSMRMSYVLSKTNIHIGTYEYGSQIRKVRYTEYIPKILSLDEERMEQLVSAPSAFAAVLDQIKEHPIDEPGVYQHGEQYIRLEEIIDGDEVFGVAVDVTTEITRRIEIERERDIDVLTGLYNRRGLEMRLAQLFAEPEGLGTSALLMIDADGLKEINDTYGHEKGDIYLNRIGQLIMGVGTKNSIAARQGGDEFVLFLYGYEREEDIIKDLSLLEDMQMNCFAPLDKEISVPLQFSYGCCMVNDETDYQTLIKEADKAMYQNKMERKGAMHKLDN